MDRMPEQPPTPAPAEPAAQMSIAQSLAVVGRVFYAPRSVYEAIRGGLPFWPALVLLALLYLAAFLFYSPYMAEAFHAMIQTGDVQLPMQGLQDLSQEEFIAKTRLPVALTFFLLSLAALIAGAFFYWLALTVTFGGASFRRIFNLKVHVSYIELLFTLLMLVYLRIVQPEFASIQELAGSFDLSPALLMGEATGFAARLLRHLNVFAIWQLAVFIGGIAFLLDRKWSKVFWPIILIFLLGIALQSISG